MRIVLAFAGRGPHIQSLLEAICAARTHHVLRGPEPLEIRVVDEGYQICVAGGSIFQWHRYWFARYMPGLCEVLGVVHQTYPIAFVRVDASPY